MFHSSFGIHTASTYNTAVRCNITSTIICNCQLHLFTVYNSL